MIRFELTRVNGSFDKLAASLREDNSSSLSSLYETLLPWYKACNEMQYPQLYTLFTGDKETFDSWDEIEDYLPYMALKEVTNNKIVIEAEEELMNNLFLLHLAIHTDTNLTLISDDELYIRNGNYEDIKLMMKLNSINYSFTGYTIKLEHIKRKSSVK